MVNKRKLTVLICLLVAMAMTFAACTPAAAPAPAPAPAAPAPAAPAAPAGEAEEENDEPTDRIGQTQLSLSFNQSIENPQARTILWLSDRLYDATEGRYSIEIFPNEQLGPQAESLALVQAGAIDMAIVANPLVENINPDFAIIGTPYVYDSIDHQLRILLSGDLDELFSTTQAAGFYVLAAYNLGPRNVYLRDGIINTPEDMAGLAIRVMQSDTMVQMMNLMGGVGTPMGQGDVYTAIQTGVLAGAENNIITYLDLLQYEVAPYYIETNHLMIPDLVIINNNTLSRMSDADQAALRGLARDSIEYMFAAAEALREDYRQQLLARGVTFHSVDITPFQDRLADFIQEVAGRSEMSQQVFEIIQSHR